MAEPTDLPCSLVLVDPWLWLQQGLVTVDYGDVSFLPPPKRRKRRGGGDKGGTDNDSTSGVMSEGS